MFKRASENVLPMTKLSKSYTPAIDGVGGDGTALS